MSEQGQSLVYESGLLQVHLERRELLASGVAVPIGARAFEIIEVLVRSANGLVTKNDIMNRIWPGAMVGENTLQVHISAIRKALGPYRNLLKTDSGRGYRLLGDWTVRRHDAAGSPVGSLRMRVDGESPVTNFPATVTRLVGRTAAVARLRDLLSAYRVVTLTGPGGIGKTSLALKVVRGIVGEFTDGAWLVELASLTDPALLPSIAAHVLRLGLGAERISAEILVRGIGAQKLLLCLDNCEHIIGPAAEFVDILVRMCPNVTILATSREILRIEGEHVYRVSSLEVPAAGRDDADHILSHSAVELFIARTKALDTGFLPHIGELQSIGAICRHLDGIPLAIEFAAAQVSTFGIQRVEAGLHDRFGLLTRGRRTALPRQQTLRGALDWSYELLSEAEQRQMRHLAIFAAGFTVEAAATVVSDGVVDSSSVMEHIANLVAKSLVALDRATPSRWYLLETIRAYALEKLSGHGEHNPAARRHAAYFRDLFSRSASMSSASVSADERTDRVREIDNLRAALDWCFSAGGDTAIGVDLAAGSALWLRVDLSTFIVDAMPGAEQSLDLLTKALDIAETLSDLDAQARALVGLITHHSFSAEHDKTRTAAQRLLEVADRIGDAALSRMADRLMGNALVMVGKPREAQGFLERFLNADHSTAEQRQSPGFPIEGRALARAFLSRALWLRGFIDQAKSEAHSSIDEARATDRPLVLCRALYYGMCRVVPTTGDFVSAEQSIARLIQTATEIKAPFWQTAGHLLFGKLLIERGEFAQGVAALNDAFDACRRTGWRMSYPEFKGALATGLAGLGQLDEALGAVNDGLEGAVKGEHGHDLFFAELLRIKGDILLRHGDEITAENSLREAIEIAHEQEALLWELRAALSLARMRGNQGLGDEAKRLLAQVYARFTEGFGTPDLRAAKAFLDELSE